MSNVLNRFKDFIGINDEPDDLDDEYYDEEDEMEQSHYPAPPDVISGSDSEPRSRYQRQPKFPANRQDAKTNSPKSNVIGMPGANNGPNEIVMLEPQSFEKMAEVIQVLRERKTVILNLNMMEPDDAQRAVDFVAGGTYAIDGHQERVGESIFLFTPSCVQVSSRSHTTQGTTGSQMGTQANVHPMPPTGNWQKQENPIAQ